jgi:hypothetical protein
MGHVGLILLPLDLFSRKAKEKNIWGVRKKLNGNVFSFFWSKLTEERKMPRTGLKALADLSLDLANFRTIPQKDELHAIRAMIAINPDRFWALMESLLDSGYLPTENILVIKDAADDSILLVKEGNRRVACLKIALGIQSTRAIEMPEYIEERIQSITDEWKAENEQIPCTVFESKDGPTVDRIVRLAHGKGEKAGRDQWTSVARARHNRNVNGVNEAALDLLEKYLRKGINLNPQQIEKWAGDYPLTVLAEAMKKCAARFGVTNSSELAKKYPNIDLKNNLDEILLNIGLETIGFNHIRREEDFALRFELPALPNSNQPSQPVNTRNTNSSTNSGVSRPQPANQANTTSGGSGQPPTGAGAASVNQVNPGSGSNPVATATNDPKSVLRTLKRFSPRGQNRDKVEQLRKEIIRLKLDKNPLAFCFLLRSMFEISAKAYCGDHAAAGLTYLTQHGKDRILGDVLRDVARHLTNNNTNTATVRTLHGATADLNSPESLLSVTSMNQLVHHPTFTLSENHICSVFGNIFPLLEAMNK